MCAFMAPIAELVLNAGEATAGAGFIAGTLKHFEEPIKKFAIEEAGQLVGSYARSHPGGMVDQSLATASNYRKQTLATSSGYRKQTKTRTTRPTRKLSR